jgi:hypothetical protein
MFYDIDHPNVTLSEWEAFKAQEGARQTRFSKIVDREDCGFFPDWFTPLARGVAIAAPALLEKAGYRQGMRRPCDWTKWDPDVYSLRLGYTEGADSSNALIVRRCDKHPWWMIERRLADVEQVLVCKFGSTPILAPDYKSAMCLAMHCNANKSPDDVRWIKFSPDNSESVKEFARQRLVMETVNSIN